MADESRGTPGPTEEPIPAADNASPPPGESSAAPDSSPPLVWPPPEHELDEWQVIPLGTHEPQVPASPAGAPSTPPTGRVSIFDPEPPAVPAGRDVFLGSIASSFRRAPGVPDPSGVTSPPPIAPPVPIPFPTRVAESAQAPSKPAPPVPATPPVDTPAQEERTRRGLPAAGLIGFCALVAVAAAVLIPYSRGSSSARLLIDSSPAGARVIIDGSYHGQTPMRIDLPPGPRRLAVEMGDLRREVALDLEEGADVARYFDFGPVAQAPADRAGGRPGTIEIRTRPAGARVTLRGEARGTTPLVLRDLPPGTHEIRLTLGGESVIRRVTLGPGRKVDLDVSFGTGGQGAGGGWLVGKSPVPLTVVLNGRALGTTARGRVPLPPGQHEVELLSSEFELSLMREITIEPGRETTLEIEMPNGRLSVNAQPWAEVWLGDLRLGETPLGNLTLPVGRHELRFRHPQLGEIRRTVLVRALTPTRVAVSF